MVDTADKFTLMSSVLSADKMNSLLSGNHSPRNLLTSTKLAKMTSSSVSYLATPSSYLATRVFTTPLLVIVTVKPQF